MAIDVCDNQQLIRESKAMCPLGYKIMPINLKMKYSNSSNCQNDVCVKEEKINLDYCKENICNLRVYFSSFSKECMKYYNYFYKGFSFTYDCIPPMSNLN